MANLFKKAFVDWNPAVQIPARSFDALAGNNPLEDPFSSGHLFDMEGKKKKSRSSSSAPEDIAGVEPVDWFGIYKDIFNFNLKNFPRVVDTATSGALDMAGRIDESILGPSGSINRYFPGASANLAEANKTISRWISGELTDSERAYIARSNAEAAQVAGLGITTPAAANRERIAGVKYSDVLSARGVTESQNMFKLARESVFDTGAAATSFVNTLFQGSTLTPAQGIQAEQYNASLDLSQQVSSLNLSMDLYKLDLQRQLQQEAEDASFKTSLFESLITGGSMILANMIAPGVGPAVVGASRASASAPAKSTYSPSSIINTPKLRPSFGGYKN